MSGNAPGRDLRTVGYVLRRTNYGESDRILNLITPQGKLAVIARGARKEKSKLAGGIELFTRSEFNLHLGRGELGVVTGAKMQRFHGGIVRSLPLLELASDLLKKVSRAAEGSDSGAYFRLIDQSLAALDAGEDAALAEAWFRLNLASAMGEELNLYRDVAGDKLLADLPYRWDYTERAFAPVPGASSAGGQGADATTYDANAIKLLRLMATSDLAVIYRVKTDDAMVQSVLQLVRAVCG